MDEPTSAEWVIGEWVTLDRELHPFEALELATVIEAARLVAQIAGCWTPATSSAGWSRWGRTMSCAWRWRRVLPAASPERRETGGGGVPGLSDAGVRLLPAVCPDCGADVLARADIEGPPPPRPFNALRIREDGTMTLRFIVGRMSFLSPAQRDSYGQYLGDPSTQELELMTATRVSGRVSSRVLATRSGSTRRWRPGSTISRSAATCRAP